MTMEFNMEWNVICRVCLQEGDMRSIYDKDEKNMTICDKISKCCNITIKRGINLPEQICNKCLEDCNIAYKFRMNCESSDAILQSFIEGNVVTDLIVSSDTGEIYKYKPPQGLNVKRVRPSRPVKQEPITDDDDGLDAVESNFCAVEEEEEEEEMIIPDSNIEVLTQFTLEPAKEDIIYSQDSSSSYIKPEEKSYSDIKVAINNETEMLDEQYELTKQKNLCTLKPVKTNKARAKADNSQSKMKVFAAQAVTSKPDGTTVIRYRRSVDEQKPLKICEICGNTYKYKHALESHMRRHRNEKPFACEICGRSFVINFELRRHMRTHTGQKPYACRFCGRRFSDFGSRIKHERTHTGERPYTCDTCGKSFAYSHVLSSHILTHTGEKRYGCPHCGKRFTKSHHLKAHLNTHLKNQNKTTIIRPVEATEIIQHPDDPIVYQTDEKMYGEVIAVLKTEPKMEQYVSEDGIKVIYSEEENRHAIDSINIGT